MANWCRWEFNQPNAAWMVYFDHQPEMLKDIPPTVGVMLVRNGGNYDFDSKKWLFSKHTGRLV